MTKINVEMASEVLTAIAGMVSPEKETPSHEAYQDKNNATALPSELELAGKSLLVRNVCHMLLPVALMLILIVNFTPF